MIEQNTLNLPKLQSYAGGELRTRRASNKGLIRGHVIRNYGNYIWGRKDLHKPLARFLELGIPS